MWASVPLCLCVSACLCVPFCLCVSAWLCECVTFFVFHKAQFPTASTVIGDITCVWRSRRRAPHYHSFAAFALALSLSLLYARTPYAQCTFSLHSALSLSLYALRSVFSVFFSSTLGQCFDSHFPLSASISTSSYYEYQRSPIESIASASPPFLLLSFSLCFSCCSCCCCFVPIKFI